MDRRDFLKTMLGTPLFAPLILHSPCPANDELFLISDNPQAHLLSILKHMGSWYTAGRGKYTILDGHPRKNALSDVLEASRWTQASSLQSAGLIVSFRPLRHPAPPSFALVRKGRILDIRKKELYSLWMEMNGKNPTSSCMTIASLQVRQPSHVPGTFVRVFQDGHVVGTFSVKKRRIKTFETEGGKVTIKIEQGTASILSSSCRNKICCSALPVSSPGERIVCAPNHFLLEMGGPGSIDTIIG